MSIVFNKILQKHIDTDKYDPDEIDRMENEHLLYEQELEKKFKFNKK